MSIFLFLSVSESASTPRSWRPCPCFSKMNSTLCPSSESNLSIYTNSSTSVLRFRRERKHSKILVFLYRNRYKNTNTCLITSFLVLVDNYSRLKFFTYQSARVFRHVVLVPFTASCVTNFKKQDTYIRFHLDREELGQKA